MSVPSGADSEITLRKALLSTWRRQRRLSKPRLALLDWDNTLRRGFTAVDWIRFLRDKHLVPTDSVTAMETALTAFMTGQSSYRAFAMRAARIVSHAYRGLDVRRVSAAAGQFAEEQPSLFPWTQPLVEAIRRRDWKPIVVSGAPQEPLQAMLQPLGVIASLAE